MVSSSIPFLYSRDLHDFRLANPFPAPAIKDVIVFKIKLPPLLTTNFFACPIRIEWSENDHRHAAGLLLFDVTAKVKAILGEKEVTLKE